MNEPDDARERQVGQLRQRLLEQHHIAGEQRAQHQAGGELAVSRRWRMSGRISPSGETAASVTVAFSQASLATRCARSSASHSRAATKPASVSDSLATSAWRVGAGRSSRASSGLADRRQMAEALDDAVDRERRDIGVGIFQQREAGLRRSDFGDGGGHRARQQERGPRWRACRRRDGRDRIDQVGVDQQRRMLEHVSAAISG